MRNVSVVLLCATAILLVALQNPIGWATLAAGIATLAFTKKHFAREILLIYISLAILGATDISTSISEKHILLMGLPLTAAILLPYLTTKFFYKNNAITFKLFNGKWTKTQIAYIGFAFVASLVIIPIYLKSTQAHLNWTVQLDPYFLTKLFIGTNALGIWDELFFVSVTLGILRRHLPFIQANLTQAVLFTSFLYELGFTGWGPLMIFPFAVLQGYIFKKTVSLLYVIAIHLTIDLILYFALINAHFPFW